MEILNTYDSITKKVLNETSGEFESVEFRQIKSRKNIKGGFHMGYKSYEEAVENIISSKLDYTILLEVKNQFTYARIEVLISATEISKKLGCTRSKVTAVIGRMIEEGLLMRVGRGAYRLNPYMYIPFRANGEELQGEWNEIKRVVDKKKKS